MENEEERGQKAPDSKKAVEISPDPELRSILTKGEKTEESK